MWFIKRKSDGKTICLLNKEYTIGRRNCSIELSDDLSVSRQHLKLSVDYSPLIQNLGPPTLQIMDLGSTYGIFVNLSSTDTGKIEPKVWVTLNVDSSFHFGVKNDWKVKWKNISVVCSALGSVERKRLNRELIMLGAKIVSNWQEDITHLVTDKIMLTQKVLDSLLDVKPIVMVEFFEKWVKVLEEDPCGSIPDVSQFTPVIGPALGQFDKQCFLPKEERKSLFIGKTFIFATPNELKSSMAIAVTKAGGNISNNVDEAFNHTNGFLLMECTSPTTSDYSGLLTNLSSRGERCIPQNEIGLAILSCSVEMYCNPRVRNLSEHSQSYKHKIGLASSVQCSLRDQETQMGNVSQLVHCKSNEPPSKRNRVDWSSEISQVLQPPTKKIHLDENATTLEIHHCDEEDNENSVRRKQVKTRQVPSVSESSCSEHSNPSRHSGAHGNETINKPRHMPFIPEISGEQPSTSQLESNNSSSYIKAATLTDMRHVEKSESSHNIQHLLTLGRTGPELLSRSTSTCQFNTPAIKRGKYLNQTVGNSSQWYGIDSPRKLNTSKLMVKSNLVRSELIDKEMVSQKFHSQVKVSQVITRIRSMKIAHFKEGKWTTKN